MSKISIVFYLLVGIFLFLILPLFSKSREVYADPPPNVYIGPFYISFTSGGQSYDTQKIHIPVKIINTQNGNTIPFNPIYQQPPYSSCNETEACVYPENTFTLDTSGQYIRTYIPANTSIEIKVGPPTVAGPDKGTFSYDTTGISQTYLDYTVTVNPNTGLAGTIMYTPYTTNSDAPNSQPGYKWIWTPPAPNTPTISGLPDTINRNTYNGDALNIQIGLGSTLNPQYNVIFKDTTSVGSLSPIQLQLNCNNTTKACTINDLSNPGANYQKSAQISSSNILTFKILSPQTLPPTTTSPIQYTLSVSGIPPLFTSAFSSVTLESTLTTPDLQPMISPDPLDITGGGNKNITFTLGNPLAGNYCAQPDNNLAVASDPTVSTFECSSFSCSTNFKVNTSNLQANATYLITLYNAGQCGNRFAQPLGQLTLKTIGPTPTPVIQAPTSPPTPSPNPTPIPPCDPSDPSKIDTALGCIPTKPINLIQDLLTFATGIGGGVALLLMISGAFQMITSAGNAEAVKKGQEQFSSAVIGLLFIIFSVLLLQIIGVDILQIPGFS